MHPFTESIDILNATTPMQQENREPEKAYREKLKEAYRPTAVTTRWRIQLGDCYKTAKNVKLGIINALCWNMIHLLIDLDIEFE